MQKIMQYSWVHRMILFCIFCISLPALVFALDVVDTNFSPQSAQSPGSNGSTVWFSTGGTMTGTTSYWNEDNDSNVIGNYLRGYYYDTQFWFFKLDWNPLDLTQNIRIISSTDKCSTGYGYRFWGYAQSETVWLINFGYSNEIYVYYCELDKQLHGYAYSEHIGFQNFEGISFEVIALSQNMTSLPMNSNDPFFVNNNTMILMGLQSSKTDIQGESISSKKWKEAIFYIVK